MGAWLTSEIVCRRFRPEGGSYLTVSEPAATPEVSLPIES